MELKPNQRRVLRPDGRVSIVGSAIWNNPEKMAKHNLVLTEQIGDHKPIATNLPTGQPKQKPVANSALIKQLEKLDLSPEDVGLSANGQGAPLIEDVTEPAQKVAPQKPTETPAPKSTESGIKKLTDK